MNHKEFFKILVGNPPPEIEFEIEVKQRETEQMPNEAVRAYCLDLVKYTRLQDLLLTSAISRISEIETKLYKYESCLLYTSPSPRDNTTSRMPSSA